MELLFQIDQKLAGMLHHDTHGRILDVTGRKPFMDIFGSIAYVFRYIGEQGDDIVVVTFSISWTRSSSKSALVWMS